MLRFVADGTAVIRDQPHAALPLSLIIVISVAYMAVIAAVILTIAK